MLETVLIIFCFILMLLGLAGSILPILPGPPLNFAGLLILAITRRFAPPLTSTLIGVFAAITVLILVMDYAIPLMGARKYGASKWGVWGSVFGMAIGIFLSPAAMLVGAFAGAVVAEWFVHKKKKEALKAGFGVMMGTLFATILRLVVSAVMTYYFIIALF